VGVFFGGWIKRGGLGGSPPRARRGRAPKHPFSFLSFLSFFFPFKKKPAFKSLLCDLFFLSLFFSFFLPAVLFAER
jgi:hypothetical protein